MRALVTGGTGFIGQALIPFLLRKEYRITVLTRQVEKLGTNDDYNISYIDSLDAINNDTHFDAIINFAGFNRRTSSMTFSVV